MFNKQNVKEFRSDFQEAVAQLEKNYGVNISLGTISFNGSELRSKMTAQKGEKVERAIKEDFKIGDTVKINHKGAVGKQWRVEKIMSKNIRVSEINGAGLVRVSPSLLVKL